MQPNTPDDLQSYIQTHGIDAELIRDIGDTPTVPAAAEALGVAPERIIKTLLFLVETPGDKDAPRRPVVVISNGEGLVDKRPLADHFGVGKKRIKLARPDVVLATLGYPAGGVPPFGHAASLPVLVDASIVAFGEDAIVYGGGGDDRTMLALRVDELLRVTGGQVLALSG